MFGKKCPRCAREIKKDFDFCPYCGTDFRRNKMEKKQRDFGLLGSDDNLAGINPFMAMNNPLMDSLLKNAMKMLSNQLGKSPKKTERMNFEMFVNGKKINLGEKQQQLEIKNPGFSDEKALQISKLPRKEAKTNVRRLSNKIIYEIELPGVFDMNNVIINKLENSVEIKAFSKDKAYVKILPVKGPITSYRLEKGKLLLEFKA